MVITRRQPTLLKTADEDRITVAVVREADAVDVGLPFYRYLVNADERPYSVPAKSHSDFEPGTYVAHINYLAGKMGVQNWTNEESVYAYAETLLFEPTLPYLLEDGRSNKANVRPAERGASVLSGLGQRLESLKAGDGTILGRSRWQAISVSHVGDVRMRWWLFEDLDKRRTRTAKGFVAIFTTNGQIHHAWDGQKLQQMVENRRRVGQRLFAQIDCDNIELKTRYKVFDSFRAQIRRGPEGRALEESVADALAHDADLDEFESHFVKVALASSAQNITASFRKRLNRALRTKVPGLATATGGGKGPKPPKPKDQADLYAEPTSMTGPEETTLLIGGRATVYMEINGIDGFVPERGEITLEGRLTTDPSLSVGDLRKGRLRLSLAASAEMPEGPVDVDVALTWVRSNGGLGRIAWPIRINVVNAIDPKPTAEPKGGGMGPTKNSGDVAFIWVAGRDQGWDDTVVGELQDLKGDDLATQRGEVYSDLKGVEELIPTIVLNKDFTDWAGYKRTIAKGASDATLDTRSERYGLAVGIIVANLTLEERKLTRKHDAWEAKRNGSDEPPTPMKPEQMQRALTEAARGVVALMPDFDALTVELDGMDAQQRPSVDLGPVV